MQAETSGDWYAGGADRAGRDDPGALAGGFLTSRQKHLQFADRYYAGYLGRAGAPTELKAWTAALQAHHLSPAEVAQALLASGEYSERLGR